MRIARWLRIIDGRVSVRIKRVIDPESAKDGLPWTCVVSGFPNPSRERPAVFFHDELGLDVTGTGYGGTARQAKERAICSLRGHTAIIIGQGRDETHRIPQELRP